MGKTQEGKQTDYELKGDGCLYYKGRICVLGDEELKKNILKRRTVASMLCTQEVLRCTKT